MQNINEAIEFFSHKVFLIPFGQIAFMFAACFICLLYARYKTGLLLSYFFIFYWGFISNRIYWMELFGDSGIGLLMYLTAVTAIALMGVLSFFQPEITANRATPGGNWVVHLLTEVDGRTG